MSSDNSISTQGEPMAVDRELPSRLFAIHKKVQDRKGQMEEEPDIRMKELSQIIEKVKESGKQFVMVDEQLESWRRQLELQLVELASKEKALEFLRKSIKLSNSDLELKLKKLETLNNCISLCRKEIDSKSEELGNIQKLIEQQTYERDSITRFVEELSEELVAKEKRHDEILEIISRRSFQTEERAKEIKASDLNFGFKRIRQEVEGEKNELNLLKDQIELEENKLAQLKRETEEESDRKKKDLKAMKAAVECNKKELNLLQNQIKLEEKKLAQFKRETKEESDRKKKDLEFINSKFEEFGKQLKAMKAAEIEASELKVGCEKFRQEVECYKKELKMLQNQIELLPTGGDNHLLGSWSGCIFAVRSLSKLSTEQSENLRMMGVKRKKDFTCLERVNGETVNILNGLELHTGVFSAGKQEEIVNGVYQLQEKGRKGELRERTYTAPTKWMRGKGRVTIQFGCCYNFVKDKAGNPPGILQGEQVDPLPSLFKQMIKRLVRWHVLPPNCVPDSCIVNIYEEGDCIPPHIDNHEFLRPFCTISFLSKCDILFGSNLKVNGPGDFSGSFSIPLPVGSVLVLRGNGADVAKHCVPAVPTKRISITFRKMDESKRPVWFTLEPDLQGIQPLQAARSSSSVGTKRKRGTLPS